MIDFFAVAPGEADEFLAAWAAGPPAGMTLYRALREPARFAAVPDAPDGGVLLIGRGDPQVFAGRQGFLGARVLGEHAVVHWSSPLMHARAVRALGDVLPGALYVRQDARP